MINLGDRLWNGAIVSPQLAEAYNNLQKRIDHYRSLGKPVPDNLLNGAHNLISGAK